MTGHPSHRKVDWDGHDFPSGSGRQELRITDGRNWLVCGRRGGKMTISRVWEIVAREMQRMRERGDWRVKR